MVRGGVLVRENDANFVRYTKLLERAWSEGRVDGKYRCPVCGMRFNDEKAGDDCCPKAKARVTFPE